MKKVDVLVIGAGTAGVNAARQALRMGAEKVLVVHKPGFLNTCVQAGCMPSKSMLAGAEHGLSFARVLNDRDEHIDRLMRALTTGLATEKFEIVEGDASFLNPHSVRITTESDSIECQAKTIVIATGSRPFLPPIHGIDSLGKLLLTSDDVVAKSGQCHTIPRRLLVLGGGAIGLELATVFHRVGSEILLIKRGRLLSSFDPEFGEERLRAANAEKGFSIRIGAAVRDLRREGDEVVALLEHDGKSHEKRFDAFLAATGRVPNTDSLALEKAGVMSDQGRVTHDEYLRTSIKHIFIAGDVTDHDQILHYAADMGKVAGHNAVVTKNLRRVDYARLKLVISFDACPSAIIGLSEQEARERGIDVLTATRRFDSIGRGILERMRFGMWKLVADRNSGKILGSQILGPKNADDLIQVLSPILYNGNTYGDMLRMTWYHPTLAEILKSLANDLCGQDNTFCPGM
ncbi:NAD(P)/FAD-dependent oxidoreductase [Candidatus Kaiserbacteria bacterium]|nr:NAD(P)/FAD-dependent oxidoreductase [Candidatus Kaiserbacteria bacterium]